MMRKPTARQMARLLRDLEEGTRADLPEGHPCRYDMPPSHLDQWRKSGRGAARRLARSGLREEAVAVISKKLAEEAAARSARRVVACALAVEEARRALDAAVDALMLARADAARYAEEASKNSTS